MGRSKERESTTTNPEPKRKRRRRARTEVSSSEESGSDNDSNSSGSGSGSGDEGLKDVEMMDTSAHAEVADSDDDDGEDEPQDTTNKFAEKGGRIPSPLRNLDDPTASARFEEYYMRLITEEFGDDLYAVRQAKDFTDKKSLPMLVRALKQGINIFDPEEKRVVVGSVGSGTSES